MAQIDKSAVQVTMSASHADSNDEENVSNGSNRPRSRSVSSIEKVVRVDSDILRPRPRLPPSPSDLDRINCHIGLQYFGNELQKAANAIFPGDQLSRYTKVDVILLSWEDEDPKLPVSLEIKELAEIFDQLYQYNVTQWLIPSDDCHNRLQTKILQFLNGSDPRHLKIVYYAGHGKLTNHGQPAWTRCDQIQPTQVITSDNCILAVEIVERSDVLL